MITKMKAYISADLRVINCANDIIATSGFDSPNERKGFGTTGGFSAGRRDMFDDSYEEF